MHTNVSILKCFLYVNEKVINNTSNFLCDVFGDEHYIRYKEKQSLSMT